MLLTVLAPLAMHIPDGFLSVPVSIVMWIVAIVVIAYALVRVNGELGEKQVPVMGVMAAAIFAGQMLNFPISGGTSGHLIGAALATIILGPWASILVMTSVVSIQALLFQDGGLLVMGSNLFNMAIVSTAVAYAVYTLVRRMLGNSRTGILAGGAISAWLSVVVTSLACALELAFSGTFRADLAFPAMAGVHAVIGIGEALITLGALSFLLASRPDLLKMGSASQKGGAAVIVGGLIIAVALAILSPIASSNPDGLESIAEQNGFLAKAQGPSFELIPDYLLPGVSSPALATILAGVIGVLVVFGVAFGIAYARKRKASQA